MAAGRSLKTLVSRRRRADSEGEEDEGPVLVDDSASEGSVLTDRDVEAEDEGEGSSVGSVVGANGNGAPKEGSVNGKKGKKGKKGGKSGKEGKNGNAAAGEVGGVEEDEGKGFKVANDTEAMMAGLRIGDQDGQAVVFEALEEAAPVTGDAVGKGERGGERQRREHEEYKKRRDQDPAFIPNRGNFFMHDTRGVQGGQGAVAGRGGFAGRGRGRGGMVGGGQYPPANQPMRADKASEMPWKHDLHESINEEASRSNQPSAAEARDRAEEARIFAKPALPQPHPPRQTAAPTPTNFSSTTLLGKTTIRVSLPGMKAPTTTLPCPVKKYVRLPDHRPPLRRDKPVRVLIPGLGPKYIFPSTERSFIFIPRQLRPNQRGHFAPSANSYQRSSGGYGYSSRRTSMYGGSAYSASLAPSRRSSIARDSTFSPVSFTGSFAGSRPNIRAPHHGHGFFPSNATSPANAMSVSGFQTPTNAGQVLHTYPLPQKPAYLGTPTATMHQPRPQKAISVTGIESPAALQMQQARRMSEDHHQQLQVGMHGQQPGQMQPGQGQQGGAFYGQLPTHMAMQQDYAQAPQWQQQHGYMTYPQPPHFGTGTGTPLSGIPEHAVHAQAFQPPGFYPGYPPQQGQQEYPGQQYPPQQPGPYMQQQQQSYYYPPPVPMYYPQQQPYMPPYEQTGPPSQYQGQPQQPHDLQQPPQQPQHDPQPQEPQTSSSDQQQPQFGMVAHEQNGMVFYLPASEAPKQGSEGNGAGGAKEYRPAEGFVPSFAMPELVGQENDDAGYYYPVDVGQGYYGQ